MSLSRRIALSHWSRTAAIDDNGTETDVNKVYALLAKNLGVSTPAKYGPERLGEQRRSVLANGKAKQVLGWSPQVDVERGMAQTVTWYREHRAEQKKGTVS